MTNLTDPRCLCVAATQLSTETVMQLVSGLGSEEKLKGLTVRPIWFGKVNKRGVDGDWV